MRAISGTILRALACALAAGGATPAVSQSPASPLFEQARQALVENYFSPTFSEQDRLKLRAAMPSSDEKSGSPDEHAGIRALVARIGDPSVRFLAPAQVSAFMTEVSGMPHTGVGLAEMLSVDIDEATRRLTVVTPMPDMPAARAGLRPGDVVVAIDGAATDGRSLADCADLLRGDAGTNVALDLLRDGRRFRVQLRREAVRLPQPIARAQLVRMRDMSIGHVQLFQFTQDAGAQTRQAVDDLLRQGAEAFVLDLRNNPGGAIPATKQVAGVFLGTKPIARLKSNADAASELLAEGEAATDAPLAVLVNEGSASAAELLAAALQSQRRANVVGTATFGKGLVHGLARLADGSALVFPQAHLQTPDGRAILGNGLKPDVEIGMEASPALGVGGIEPGSPEDAQFVRAVAVLVGSSR